MSPLSHGELRQMEEAAKNKTAPIVVDIDTIYKELRNDLDEKIMQAVLNCDIKVDKAELIRALELDKKVRNGELVEVVRCKDCKWSEPYRVASGNVYFSCTEHCVSALSDNDYCSYGERKEKTDEKG